MEARQQFTQRVTAQKLDVTARTISRWEKRQTQIPLFVGPALREILRIGPVRSDGHASFTFIDLFAGIGGMRSGFEMAGGLSLPVLLAIHPGNPGSGPFPLAPFGIECMGGMGLELFLALSAAADSARSPGSRLVCFLRGPGLPAMAQELQARKRLRSLPG
jgi:hypothetical protein